MKRVANEIGILREMMSVKHVIEFREVIHTQSYLYLVTEACGADLFDFFDQYPDGVQEVWAKKIVREILNAVSLCHSRHYCHRDIKPENILLEFDPLTGTCLQLKLCDFGLGLKYEENTLLNEFCGSPGFFAPEMITKGSYYGDKADIWSVGCVALELLLGHEVFCDIWMVAYDYVILQDKEAFKSAISDTVRRLGDGKQSKNTPAPSTPPRTTLLRSSSTPLPSPRHVSSGVLEDHGFSADLIGFIFKCLGLRSSERGSAKYLLGHAWLSESASVPLDRAESPLCLDVGAQSSEDMFNEGVSTYLASPIDVASSCSGVASLHVSSRERKMMEDFNSHHGSEQLHLPPLEPATPSISKLRKMLL